MNITGIHRLIVAGEVVRETKNIITQSGGNLFAQSLMWSGVEDQATNLGIGSPTYLAPLYGALGTGTGTAADTDMQLFTEWGRDVVAGGAASPDANGAYDFVFSFYFNALATNLTVTESGVFAQANSSPNNGVLLNHAVYPSPYTWNATETLTLQISFAIAVN